MLASATVGLKQNKAATDLVAALGIRGAATVMLRLPFNGTGDGVAVRVGGENTSPTSGYTLDLNAPSVTVKLQSGDRLFASWAGGSQGAAQIDVIAYTT